MRRPIDLSTNRNGSGKPRFERTYPTCFSCSHACVYQKKIQPSQTLRTACIASQKDLFFLEPKWPAGRCFHWPAEVSSFTLL
uniref:Uncharacterized protein n=1 Tax=Arundo donax TaxID=35708 RepID=A0A0A9Q1G2_ARUDO